jgi:diguanylate cyclase (GGDEF)-like protein
MLSPDYMHGEPMDRQEELTIISNASVLIISRLDIQHIVRSLVGELRKVADINWLAIARIEGNDIHYLAFSADTGSIPELEDRMPIKGTAYEWLAAQRKTLVEPDLLQESRFVSNKPYIRQGIRSIAHFPLQKGKRLTGCITVASHKPNAYGPEFISILERLTLLIAAQIENATLYDEAIEMARIDDLTGLHNRRALNEMIMSEIKRCVRYGGVFSLIILDIDTLKPVNDTYGHLAGDEYIRQVGGIIQKAIRSTDRAFRYGGDEFSILLPQTTAGDATRVAERVRQQIASGTNKAGAPITCSLGVASWPANGPDANDLINAADTALYHAKRYGRNRSNNDTVISPEDEKIKKEPDSVLPPVSR